MSRVLRVGGVHEPFNLPFELAFEDDAFADLGLEVTFTDYDGGTGALVGALESGALDLATVLTEGGVTAIARGSDIRLHSAFTTTPLRWGVHAAADTAMATIADAEGARFAISRYGSGSELMAYVLADDQGWELDDDQFVVVGGVDGATRALPAGDAELFLWERFVTAPLVVSGIFSRIGEIPTPWPAFYVAARPGLLEQDRALVDAAIERVFTYAARLSTDVESTLDLIVDRYGMDRLDAATWLEGVTWPSAVGVDRSVLASVMERMAELGRIDAPVAVDELL